MDSSRKGKILVITELFSPTKGGTAVWFDEAYRRFSSLDVEIITSDVPGSEAFDALYPHKVYRIKLKRYWWIRPESLLMYMRFMAKSISRCLAGKVTSIHAGRVLPEGLVAWVVARLFGKKVIIYSHGEEITTWRQAAKFRAMKMAYKRADLVIANSDFTEGELIKIGVDVNRIKIINPGVDLQRYRPGIHVDELREKYSLDTNGKLLLSVGRLSRRKGFDQVIRSLGLLKSQSFNLQYAVVGIGDDYEYLKDIAEQCGVSDKVYFLGEVSADELPLWYNACDIFVMPNRVVNNDTEGFGMVFVEAAACGKPAIAGIAGGTGSAVIDGVTGFRVDGENLEAVSGAIEKLCMNDVLLREMGRRAMQRAHDKFSWDTVASSTRLAIESLS